MRRSTCLSIAITALLSGRGALGGDDSRGLKVDAPDVWLRTFDPPATVDTFLQQVGETFHVLSPQLGALYVGSGDSLFDAMPPCQVTTEVRAAERGFDVIYDVYNPAFDAIDSPALVLGGFPLSQPVEYLNHTNGCVWEAAVPMPGGALITPSMRYPAPLYSPVMVLRNQDIAIGLSLQYPVLEYRQQLTTFAALWPGASEWTVYFFLKGKINAGESRQYILSVRYAFPADWIHTIQPYRDYFWSHYGSQPTYTQDRRPVYAVTMASTAWFGPGNDRGFYLTRPDLEGWQQTVDSLFANAVEQAGYRRIMIWAASGLYLANSFNNYPPQFMTEWPAAMVKTADELLRLRRAGIQFCFWWGHSAHVADRWDDDLLEPFDTAMPAHQQAMQAELTLAMQRGASGVGLDAFELMPLATALPWLETMRFMKPDAFFIVEGACADIMHLRVPFLVQGADVPLPHLLADYLVPGREIWVYVPDVDHAKEVNSWGMTICWNSLTPPPG